MERNLKFLLRYVPTGRIVEENFTTESRYNFEPDIIVYSMITNTSPEWWEIVRIEEMSE